MDHAAFGLQCPYAYDNLGRRTSITHDLSGIADVVMTHAYDLAGNRAQLTATIGTVDDFVNDYTYDNRPGVGSLFNNRPGVEMNEGVGSLFDK